MNYLKLTKILGIFVILAVTPQIAMSQGKIDTSPTKLSKPYTIDLSESEWRDRLNDFEFRVLRDKGTEYAFSSKLNKEKRKGIYYSRATGQPLFSSEHKYESGTGWPSFWRPIDEAAIHYFHDGSFFMSRIEVTDSSSGSHLGHVFDDGPNPTGLRYCINGVSLIFVPEGENPPSIVKEYLDGLGKSNKS